MQRSVRRWGIGLIVVAAVAMAPLAYSAASPEDNPAGQIGAGEVALDESMLSNPSLIRAFIPTGSKSHRCLVTYGETTAVGALSVPFCGARSVNGVDGVLVTIGLTQEVTDLFLSLTVYQQFAKGYGAPVLYTGE